MTYLQLFRNVTCRWSRNFNPCLREESTSCEHESQVEKSMERIRSDVSKAERTNVMFIRDLVNRQSTTHAQPYNIDTWEMNCQVTLRRTLASLMVSFYWVSCSGRNHNRSTSPQKQRKLAIKERSTVVLSEVNPKLTSRKYIYHHDEGHYQIKSIYLVGGVM